MDACEKFPATFVTWPFVPENFRRVEYKQLSIAFSCQSNAESSGESRSRRKCKCNEGDKITVAMFIFV